MAKIYVSLIEKGLKTIEDVPEKLKEQVMELLGMMPVPELEPELETDTE